MGLLQPSIYTSWLHSHKTHIILHIHFTMATGQKTVPLDRIDATIYGNCIGDAIGLLTEFMTKKQAAKYYTDKKGSLEYEHKVPDKHRSRWTNGDWTDDSDQMILIMQSITDTKGMMDEKDFAQKILHWARNGFPELGDTGGNGLGSTTNHVLKHEAFTQNPHYAAEYIWSMSGRTAAPNGAVMRTSVLGIFQYHDIEKVVKNTLVICKVTHADYRCQASCIAVTTAIAMMLQGKHYQEGRGFDVDKLSREAFGFAEEYIPEHCENYKEYRKEMKEHMFAKEIKELKLDESRKIGHTFKALGAGFWALRQNDFRKALETIVMEAGDADTNGAVAGALLGCKLGQTGLPKSWRQGLVHTEWLNNIIKKFIPLATMK